MDGTVLKMISVKFHISINSTQTIWKISNNCLLIELNTNFDILYQIYSGDLLSKIELVEFGQNTVLPSLFHFFSAWVVS